MHYLLYALLALVSLAFNLFVMATCWLWAGIAAVFKLTTLPGFLSWVHTHDDDIYGSRTTGDPIPATITTRFKRACWWLFRNPGYGLDAYVLGFAGSEIVAQDTTSNGAPWNSGGAWRIDWMTLANGRKRFSYRRDLPLWGDRYVKIWLGWHYFDQAGRRMMKFDINPLKRAD